MPDAGETASPATGPRLGGGSIGYTALLYFKSIYGPWTNLNHSIVSGSTTPGAAGVFAHSWAVAWRGQHVAASCLTSQQGWAQRLLTVAGPRRHSAA